MNTTTPDTIAENIAALLPGAWTVKPLPHNHGHYLQREDGLTLWFRPCYNEKTKFRISWDQPAIDQRYGHGYTVYDNGTKLETPGIGVSKAKNPEAIAGEIVRRLLPDCERIEPLARQFVADVAESYAKQGETRARLMAVTGYTPPDHCPDKISLNHRGNLNRGYGDATVNAGGSVSFELRSVPADSAVKLAEFLKTLFQ